MKTRYDVRAYMDSYSFQIDHDSCKGRFELIRTVLRFMKKYDCVQIIKRHEIGR